MEVVVASMGEAAAIGDQTDKLGHVLIFPLWVNDDYLYIKHECSQNFEFGGKRFPRAGP